MSRQTTVEQSEEVREKAEPDVTSVATPMSLTFNIFKWYGILTDVSYSMQNFKGSSLGYGLDDRGSIPGRGWNFFLLATASGAALGPTQLPVRWLLGVLSPVVKWRYRWLTTHLHLQPRSRMRGAIPPLLRYVFMAWCLVYPRDDFTLPYVYVIATLTSVKFL
jgi:hypothetical protein